MEQYGLPDGWMWTSIGDICESVEQVDPRRTPQMRFRYIDISSIDNTMSTIAAPKELLGAEAPSRARKPVQADDVIFSTVRTYLRNVARIPNEYDGAIASTGFCVLRARRGILPGYIFHYVRTIPTPTVSCELSSDG